MGQKTLEPSFFTHPIGCKITDYISFNLKKNITLADKLF